MIPPTAPTTPSDIKPKPALCKRWRRVSSDLNESNIELLAIGITVKEQDRHQCGYETGNMVFRVDLRLVDIEADGVVDLQ